MHVSCLCIACKQQRLCMLVHLLVTCLVVSDNRKPLNDQYSKCKGTRAFKLN